ncbi:GerMN domain-containing protein [Sporolactobacillus shoreicorticis]|uniref:GerMN domain-containing protein n=1 Tax=Sporolactobacillus shoreicorticis TaxID=1923877 RepID=A0ABW5RZQ4_9BACL|nr:GerMN domain-containing protein [Sporolactobacillus shoreicorticis]MCO7124752.1 GerMN domain-containing protein [Sporolactobacillus shoreicorticis]
MYRRTSFILAGACLALSMTLLAGCGNMADREPDSVKYVNSKSDLAKTSTRQQFTERVLYLTDANGFVVPQMIGLPKSNAVTKQVLNYLVADGPISNLLPNGFQATLPSGTEVKHVSTDQRGNATADFSKDLLDIPAANQRQAVQSIVWTLTQFPAIKSVTITVNGKALDTWPSTKNEVGRGLTRADGINQVTGDVADVSGSEPLTVYYMAANKGKTYDVPVTVRGTVGSDRVTGLVNALIHEPAAGALISPMNPDIQLTQKPRIKNGTVFLHFNSAIYDNKKARTINDQVIRSLVLTLTGDPAIQKVSIQVGNSTKMTLESGKTLSGAVSREWVDATGL